MSLQHGAATSLAITCAFLAASPAAAQEPRPSPLEVRDREQAARLAAARLARDQRVKADIDREMIMLDAILEQVDGKLRADPAVLRGDPRRLSSAERLISSLAFGDAGPDDRRSVFLRMLDGDIRDARRSLKISPAQERKLRLAAEGDMKRYADDVTRLRGRFAGAVQDRDTRQEVLAEVRRLKGIGRLGPFGEGSIYAKVLEKLRQEQAAAGPRGEGPQE